MKNIKRIAVIFAAMCVTAAVCGCGNNKNEPVKRGEQQTQEKVIDYNAPSVVVKMDSISKSMLDVNNPETVLFSSEVGKLDIYADDNGNLDAARKINDTMRRAYDYNTGKSNEYMASYTATDGSLMSWAYESTYEVLRNDGYVVSLAENIYMNGGSPYPVIERFGYNFDAQTGELLTLETLFGVDEEKNNEVLDKLNELIYNDVAANYTSEKAEMAMQYIGETTLEIIASRGYWSLDDKGMTIVYSAGSILPRAEGEIKVEITSKELLELSSDVSKYFK